MVIYSHFLLFSWWQGSLQRGSMFACHHVRTSCLHNLIAMASLLATSQEIYGHYSHRWDMARPHFLSEPQGCFEGTLTCGMSCGYLREVYDWLYLLCDWGLRTKVDIRGRNAGCCTRSFGRPVTQRGWSNASFTIPPLPESRLRRSWSPGVARRRSRSHWMLCRSSKADPCIGSRFRRGHQGGQAAGRTWRVSQPKDHGVGGPM
jgi:hypothetical protein